ncbi:MAG: fatty acid desaturase family protein [Acidimicrobiales bacterium]
MVGTRINSGHDNPAGDRSRRPVPRFLDAETVAELSRVRPGRALGRIAVEWLLIATAIVVTIRVSWWLYPLAVVVIGSRIHSLLILMHEGAHRRLIGHQVANDTISELFLAFPVFVTLRGYRVTHFAHHRHINEPADPDLAFKANRADEWMFPKTTGGLVRLLLPELLGVRAHRLVMEMVDVADGDESTRPPRWFVAGRVVFYAVGAAVLTMLGWWVGFVLFWMVPVLTWLAFTLRLRSVQEHFGLELAGPLTMSRSTTPTVFDRIFLAPANVSYHLDHHLYPSVPYYRVPELHRRLMGVPGFAEHAHLTEGFVGVLRELTGRGDSSVANAPLLEQASRAR